MTQYQGSFNQPSMSPPSMTPPQYGGDIPTQPSSWPTVLGVLLIVLASLGLMSNVCGGIAAVFMPALMSQMGSTGQDDAVIKAQMDMASKYMAFNLANASILIVLGVILLIGGIGLLRRRRSAAGKVKLWAIGRMIWSLPAAYMTYLITADTLKVMQQAAADNNQPMPAGVTVLFDALGPISAVVNLFMWCAVPVFVLIWFMRRRIKNEVAAWN